MTDDERRRVRYCIGKAQEEVVEALRIIESADSKTTLGDRRIEAHLRTSDDALSSAKKAARQ